MKTFKTSKFSSLANLTQHTLYIPPFDFGQSLSFVNIEKPSFGMMVFKAGPTHL